MGTGRCLEVREHLIRRGLWLNLLTAPSTCRTVKQRTHRIEVEFMSEWPSTSAARFSFLFVQTLLFVQLLSVLVQ
jgi:hypothetical protein